MTSKEEDDLADEVRMSQPPKRRAKIGFHRDREARGTSSLDSEQFQNGSVAGSSLGVEAEFAGDRDPDEAMRDTHLSQVSRDEIARIARQHGKWAAMTSISPAPMPLSSLFSPASASALRERMRRVGGPRAAARAWLDGEASPEVADTYFAAFGDIDELDRDAVAETFIKAPESSADGLYSEWVKHATLSPLSRDRRRPQ